MQDGDDVQIDSEEEESVAEEQTIFDVLGVTWKELVHSKVLAWLLNPVENHDIGDEFLRTFFEACRKQADEKKMSFPKLEDKPLSREHIRVKTEYQLSDRSKPDIVLYSRKEKWLCIIENKIGAAETGTQTAHYAADVSCRFSEDEYPDKGFVYLSPHGGRPSSPVFIPVPYSDVLTILKPIEDREGLTPLGRTIVKEYRMTIQNNFVPKQVKPELAEGVRSLWAFMGQIKIALTRLGYDPKKSWSLGWGGWGGYYFKDEKLPGLDLWLGIEWDRPEQVAFTVENGNEEFENLKKRLRAEGFDITRSGNPVKRRSFEQMDYFSQKTAEEQVNKLKEFCKECVDKVVKHWKASGGEKR